MQGQHFVVPSRLRRERYGSRPGKRLTQPGEHHKVSVKLDGETTNAERGEAVLVLQASELALDSRTSTVEVPPSLRLARDERAAAVSLDPPSAFRQTLS